MKPILLIFCLVFVLANALVSKKLRKVLKNADLEEKKDEVCMGNLGCFNIPDDFKHPVYRPINLLPDDRNYINTSFFLFTPRNSLVSQYIVADDDARLQSSFFDPKLPTKFIIHGFIDRELFGTWQRDMKNQFLMQGSYNIFVVDWSGGNKLPYAQAAANARVVGAEISYLIKYLENKTGPLNKVHVIGHSLGAHAASYVGKAHKNIDRISGLDPAEPYFQNMPPTVRLDMSDAEFVDVIHTDSKSILLLGLGMSQAVGHVDFYPNNGRDQPGCEKTSSVLTVFLDGLVAGLRDFIACDHMRAVEFYMSSINNHQCAFVSYPCHDWGTFKEGHCTNCGPKGEKCALMGFEADKYFDQKTDKSVKLYLEAGEVAPYCVHHYRVILKLTKVGDAKDEKGKIKITILGERGKISADVIYKKGVQNLYPGSQYSYMVSTPLDIGDITGVTFSWESNAWITALRRLYVESIRILPMSIADFQDRQKAARTLCYNPYTGIPHKTNTEFKPAEKC